MQVGDLVRNSATLRSVLALPIALRRRVLRSFEAKADTVLDNIAATAAEDIELAVAEFDGARFQMSPHSDIFRRIARTRAYEPEITAQFRRFIPAQGDILDIGANIGLFAVFGARLLSAGRVAAIEPTAGAYARLLKNIALNGVEERVIPIRAALSDQSGTTSIQSIEGREEYSSLGELLHPFAGTGTTRSDLVPCHRLDDLVAEQGLRPKLIKMDVEGAEGLVLRGAASVLREHQPVIITELSDPLLRAMGSSSSEVIDLLRSLDYKLTDPIHPGLAVGRRSFGDLVGIPRHLQN